MPQSAQQDYKIIEIANPASLTSDEQAAIVGAFELGILHDTLLSFKLSDSPTLAKVLTVIDDQPYGLRLVYATISTNPALALIQITTD